MDPIQGESTPSPVDRAPRSIDLLVPLVIGVTGHRDLPTENEADMARLKGLVRGIFVDLLDSRYKNTPIVLLTSLAEGADRLVADVAVSLGCRLVVPLPMPVSDYEADFHAEASRDEFRRLLNHEQTHRVFVVDEDKIGDLTRQDERNLCYERAGAYIARSCQILVALWDGVGSGLTGGTSEVVAFHRAGLPTRLDPMANPLDQPETGPVYHVITPHAKLPEPRGKLTLAELYPNVSDTQAKDDPSAKIRARDSFERVYRLIDGFNRDVATIGPSIAVDCLENRRYVIPDEEWGALPDPLRHRLDRYAMADSLALRYQGRVHRRLKGLLLLAFVVTALFQAHVFLRKTYKGWAVASEAGRVDAHWIVTNLYPWGLDTGPESRRWAFHLAHNNDVWLAWYDLAYLGATIFLFAWYWWRWVKIEDQKRYLDDRALAEGLRVQFFWRLAGLPDSAADHYLRKQKSELDWIRAAIRADDVLQGTDCPTGPPGDAARLDQVRRRWVEDQLKYFIGLRDGEVVRGPAKAIEADRTSRAFRKFGRYLPWVVVSLAVVRGFAPPGNLVVIALALAAAALVLAGTFGKVMAFSDHAKQYGRMGTIFSRARTVLVTKLEAGRLDEARALLRSLGEESLAENADWVLLHRDRPLDLPRP